MDTLQSRSLLLSIRSDKVYLCAACWDRLLGCTLEERAELIVEWTPEGIGYWIGQQGRMDRILDEACSPHVECMCRGCGHMRRRQ